MKTKIWRFEMQLKEYVESTGRKELYQICKKMFVDKPEVFENLIVVDQEGNQNGEDN